MTRIALLLICTGCSIVNSTGDLRDLDLDGSMPDGQMNGPDSGPEVDGGREVDGGLEVDGGPCVLPRVERLEVVRPSHPPILAVVFASPPACDAELPVTSGGVSVEVAVVAGELRAPFVYRGLRVPLFDPMRRMRTFIVAGDDYPVQMPIEQLQALSRDGTLLDSVSYSFNPSLDISNDGIVVFDSDDEALESDGGGDIYQWRVDGIGMSAATVEKIAGDTQQLAAASISDDGMVVAFANRGSRTAHLWVRGEGVFELPIAGGATLDDVLNLDVRQRSDSDTEYAVLLRVRGPSGSAHFEVWGFDTDEESFSNLLNGPGERGRLFRHDEEFGYSAIADGVPFGRTRAGSYSPGCDMPMVDGNNTRVFMLSEKTSQTFAYVGVCGVGGVQLHVGGRSVAVPGIAGLVDISDDHSTLLMRSNTAVSEETAFVVGDRNSLTEAGLQTLNRDGRGDIVPTAVEFHLSGSALSPNGEWAAYAIVDPAERSERRMRIYRVRTRPPGM